MDREHRSNILNNIDKLIENTEYGELMDACLKNQLLADIMRENIEKNPSPIIRHRKLIEKITHRGPTAYRIFEKILKEHFPEAAATLTNSSNDVSIRERLHRAQSHNGHVNEATNQINQLPPTTIINKPPTAIIQPSQSLPNTSNANQSPPRRIDPIELIEYKTVVKPKVKITVKYSEKFHFDNSSKIGTYAMNTANRGILILVNNINFKAKSKRNGATVDRDNMIYLFRDMMKFKVYYFEDLTSEAFSRLIRKVANWRELQKYDCFVFAVLSHGDGSETSSNIEFVDGLTFSVEDILIQFNNFNCKYLVGKPKIFFFPFCRGPLSDRGTTRNRQTESDSARDNDPSETNIPSFSDMKICYATLPGYNAFRDPELGSFYIEVMCKIFAQHAHDTHLEDLLKLIGTMLEKMRTERFELQTASNEDRGFNKKLYFNPGFYLEQDIEESI